MNTKNNSATARVERPHRSQVEMQFFALDQLLSPDHRVRIVWAFVQSLNLEPLYEEIRVTDSLAGRSAIAPEILVTLWLEATLDGIGSGRELDRRCQTDIVYLWVLGGVTVNYHTLSDFRVRHGAFLERLLTDSVAVLIDRGLVPLETIAQDGMRVRASAGSSSFRRRPTLEKLQQQAQEHLDRLKAEAESDAARQEGDARRRAAAARAARERQERIGEALRQHGKLSAQREKRTKGDGAFATIDGVTAVETAGTEVVSSIAEFPNADCRNRNLRQFRVRGLAKVKAVALWHALAFNFLRMINLEVLAV